MFYFGECYEKGSTVKIIQPVVQGEIKKVEWDEDADEKRFFVDFKNEDGSSKARWVTESQVEVV